MPILIFCLIFFIGVMIIFIHYSSQERHEQRELIENKSVKIEPISDALKSELGKKISSVVIHIIEPSASLEKFENQAKRVAQETPFDEGVCFLDFQHNPPEPSREINEKLKNYPPLGSWMALCQRAIYQILYNYKLDAYETINSIAFGEYDWTQIDALDVLYKWAKEGIMKETITHDIIQNFDSFRYEAQMPCMQMLAKMDIDERINSFFRKQFLLNMEEPDQETASFVLENWIINYPDQVLAQRKIILNTAKGKGFKDVPFESLPKEMHDQAKENYAYYKEENSLKFLLLLRSLEPNNEESKRLYIERKKQVENEQMLELIEKFESSTSSV